MLIRTSSSLKILLCSAALALSVQQSAQAYWSSDFLMYDVSSRLTLQNTFDNHNRVYEMTSSSGKKKKASAPKKNPAAYRYAYSQAVSTAVGEDFIANLLENARKNNALDAATEEKIRAMQGWNYIPYVRESFQTRGIEADNIASAIAFWLATSYGTIKQVEGGSLDTAKLQDQLEVAMSTDKTLLAASDADKQRIAENVLWQSLLQIVLLEEAGNDPAQLQAVVRTVRENLQSYGIDVDAMRLGSEGLLLK